MNAKLATSAVLADIYKRSCPGNCADFVQHMMFKTQKCGMSVTDQYLHGCVWQ